MTERFTEHLRQAAAPIWAAIERQPFLRELGAGTLPVEKFLFFVRQDSAYLRVFARVLALAAVKSEAPSDTEQLAEHARSVFQVEEALHKRVARELGSTLEGVEMAPTAYAYTRHLLAVGYNGSLAEIIGAVLPCYWIYADAGRRLAQNPPDHPIFADWITTYVSPAFQTATAQQIERLERLAARVSDAERRRITEYFLTSSRYEYLFWDMAYRIESWPV